MIEFPQVDSCYQLRVKSSYLISRLPLSPLGTEYKLNVHKMFRRRSRLSGDALGVLCMFNLRPVPRGSISHNLQGAPVEKSENVNLTDGWL